mmetsp:Transcript_39296/g.54596  ORF Transcript_39296/g.54596 Transcript_39296/m.54596 type:complete len:292 (+) Transcript_39296:81-956(+)
MDDTARVLGTVFASMFSVLFVLSRNLTKNKEKGVWLCPKEVNESKRAAEIFTLWYSTLWISAVVIVIALQAFEHWDAWGYMTFCCTCALPLLLYPLIFPLAPDRETPFWQTYIFKANCWQAIFSFIGNYWYTHYFYRVLAANYTFPAHRLNDVPLCLYFMTHVYFMFYHVLSNMALRFVRSKYQPGWSRWVFEVMLVVVMSYVTAFIEAVTICGFPYYKFADRHMALTLGSAFYGIYFLVSFPMFLLVDEEKGIKYSLFQTVFESLGSGMLVLCLLDFVRLALGIPLFVPH